MSGGIGEFIIGVTPIGIETTGPDYPLSVAAPNSLGVVPFSFWSTIIVQYANSPTITQLIGQFQQFLDQTTNLSNFYDDMWNVATARGYGLDCWGRIVGVTRTIYLAGVDWFGFSQGSPNSVGFGQGPFYAGESIGGNYQIVDESYRTLIFAKAMANISDGSVPSINRILMALFPGRGNCYCAYPPPSTYFGFSQGAPLSLGFGQAPFYRGESSNNMTMTYTFEFPLSDIELAIVQQSGVLPKPTGVAASVVII